MKLTDLPIDLKRQFLIQCKAFTIACCFLEIVSKKCKDSRLEAPVEAWAAHIKDLAIDEMEKLEDKDVDEILRQFSQVVVQTKNKKNVKGGMVVFEIGFSE